jgi:hypothetical protein
VAVGSLAISIHELVKAHDGEAIRRDLVRSGVDPPQPALPPLDPLLGVAGIDDAPSLRDPRRGGVAPVAHRVDEPRLGEDPEQRRALGHGVAAHLDEAGLVRALGKRGQELEEELAARCGGVSVVRRPELVDGGVEPLARNGPVQAAHLQGLHTPPPRSAQLGDELVGRNRAREQVREPARVAVEPDLVADLLVAGVAPHELRDDVSAAAAGAADE